MFRRMYGTYRHTASHSLIPIANGPWLRAKSEVPMLVGICCGAVAFMLLTLLFLHLGDVDLVPDAIGDTMLLLSALASVAALVSLIWLVVALVCRASHQYCPECLSYMTRGATVCPFCGFRGDVLGASSDAKPRDRARLHP